jgi:hypothetical protein
MQNLLNDLTDLLSQDDRLVIDGKLLKNKIPMPPKSDWRPCQSQ